ncbi:PRD domain-containing protein [Enterococcus rivorum]|uniref:Transcription antiterminator n=1 Tax=Enterococcus rivorum TaxID=762845 RepID=A0A1E5KX35_9ENTE|nr:PRD domain-containing protein [Enterococcus rivorum]MBP2097233.1 beta-glucoside operon transcriptional antiterminator [Enterococcus rivorum]OEH82413.1 transcription antiterminator [Enterococcus rivorum]
MLQLIKTLNNNIVLAKNEKNEEIVVFGTGIGFNRKKGELVDMKQVTKVFKSEPNSPAEVLLENISSDLLVTTEKIIQLGENRLKKKLSPSILFSLADHIRFAIERSESNLENDNPLQWEIPHLYFSEYEVGKEALTIITNELQIQLPMMEASFIALHFVNAQVDGQTMGETIQITQLTKNIVKIIQSLFGITLDKTTLNYSRFTTHLRYFIARQESADQLEVAMDTSLKEVIQERYMKSYACGLLIKEMLKREFHWIITEDELVYLVVHIERLIKENK